MWNWLLALVARPFIAIVLFGFIALPISLAIKRHIPEGKTKDWLYSRYMSHSVRFRWTAVILIYVFIAAVSFTAFNVHEWLAGRSVSQAVAEYLAE